MQIAGMPPEPLVERAQRRESQIRQRIGEVCISISIILISFEGFEQNSLVDDPQLSVVINILGFSAISHNCIAPFAAHCGPNQRTQESR